MLLLLDFIRRTWRFLLSCFEPCGVFLKGEFATDGSEIGSLEKGVLVVNVALRGG